MKSIYSNRNVMVISLTSSVIMFFTQIYNPFWPLYLGAIGFSLPQIGLLTAIQGAEQFIFQLPGGILADRIGRKKVSLIVAFERILTPLIFLFFTSWEGILLASLLRGFESIGGPAFQAIVAESLPKEKLGAGYGMYNMMQRVPSIFTGILGGILMDIYGIIDGTRICFVGSSVIALIVFLARYFFLTETLNTKSRIDSNLKSEIAEVIPYFKGTLLGMLFASAMTQFSLRIVTTYAVIYVVDIIGFSNTQWGIIVTVMSLLNLITSIPSGYMADRYDKRKLLTLTRAIEPASTFGYILLRDFWQILAVRVVAGVGMGLAGGNTSGMLGGPAWLSLIAALIPPEKRGRVNGLMGTMSGSLAFMAPYIAAYTWENVAIGPDGTLLISGVFGLGSSLVVWFTVRDPRYQQTSARAPL
ncbi:MFS transporter [Candidatus Bathyarchaeota archaeon]|nr:MFS transporter [Candidatus Bathyarchaeota archaeon]